MKVFVAILLIAAVPTYAQAKDRGAAKLSKGDAQKVATIIRSDKTKTQTYCEINKISDQMNQAYGKNDRKTVDDLSQKIERLEKVLGPRCGDYVAIRGTRQVVYEIGPQKPRSRRPRSRGPIADIHSLATTTELPWASERARSAIA